MATSNFTEEEILFRRRARRRLVGAVVLVVTVVAVVPMILPENKPQQDTQQIEISIPAQDATGYAPKIQPAPAPATAPLVSGADKPATAVAPVIANTTATVAPVKDKEPAKPDALPATAVIEKKPETPPAPAIPEVATPPAKAVKEPVKASAAAKQTYFVQYGAFSEQKNAKQRQADLKVKGINTFTEVVKTSAGDKIRVRSGPYKVREDAEKIRLKVKPLDSKLVVTGNPP